MSTQTVMSREQSSISREVRFGAVFFGGASLAIYEYGVALELLGLVRSSTQDGDPDAKKPTERVYGEIGRMLAREPGTACRFCVDILSGTSAGGINAVFLGKALAQGKSLDHLHQLWLEQADLSTLLNDGRSLADTNGRLTALQTTSLLNSQRMYLLLLLALEAMDGEAARAKPVEQCDVWITTTDLRGMTVPIRLSYQQANEREFKHAFHFRFKSGMDAVDEFEAQHNPALAFAARCTSSFPAAFEPVQLEDIDVVVGEEARQKFVWNSLFERYKSHGCAYEDRFFADGGYLHNKPLSFVVDELLERRADLPVERKLIYVDPFPESGTEASGRPGRPTAFANTMKAATTLPRYQTIREEVGRVMAHNAMVDRVDRILKQTGTDQAPALFYWNLRVSSVTDEIANMVSRALGFEDDAVYERAIRALVRAWREREYGTVEASNLLRLKEYLSAYDLSYYIRRLDFILQRLNELGSAGDALLKPYRAAADCLCDLKTDLYSRSEANPLAKWISEARKGDATGVGGLRETKSTERLDAAFDIGSRKLLDILGLETPVAGKPLTEEAAEKNAQVVLEADGNRDVLCGVALRLAREIETMRQASKVAYRQQHRYTEVALEEQMNRLHDNFENYDGVIFPITFGTELGEGGEVDVIRISPADRAVFTKTGRTGRALMGDCVMAFGGFLERSWRESDMIWGRIDAAEQMITALLCDRDQAAIRQEYIERAVAAILFEEGLVASERATRDKCDAALVELGRRVDKPLPRATVMDLVGRSTRIAGQVIADATETVAGEGKMARHAGMARFFAGGLCAVAAVLGYTAEASASVLRAFASNGGQPKPRGLETDVEAPQAKSDGLAQVQPGDVFGAHRNR